MSTEQQQIEQAMKVPLEDQRAQALKHYEEASSAIHHSSSFVENAIKAYNPQPTSSPDVEEAAKDMLENYREFVVRTGLIDRKNMQDWVISYLSKSPLIAGASYQYREVQEWVSVEDGLPEYDEVVDVYGVQKTMHPQMGGNPAKVVVSNRIRTEGTAIHVRREKYVDVNGFRMMESVTHWRKRPQPPSQSSNK